MTIGDLGFMLKAIPTYYNGIRFRSRLEARWAVFFDTLGVKYYYEYEGYQLKSGWYLPDFYLPDINLWVEIKGPPPTDEERTKLIDVSVVTGKRAAIVYGNIKIPDEGEYGKWTNIELLAPVRGNYYMWCECAGCGKIDVQLEGRSYRIECECGKKDDKGYNYVSDRLLKAYNKAMRYQFSNLRKRSDKIIGPEPPTEYGVDSVISLILTVVYKWLMDENTITIKRGTEWRFEKTHIGKDGSEEKEQLNLGTIVKLLNNCVSASMAARCWRSLGQNILPQLKTGGKRVRGVLLIRNPERLLIDFGKYVSGAESLSKTFIPIGEFPVVRVSVRSDVE